MTMNTNLLIYAIGKKSLSMKNFAKKIGLTEQSLIDKMSGKSSFLLGEVKVAQKVLNLSDEDVLAVFFE